MIQIKHRYTDTVLCEFDVKTIKEAVIQAKNTGANLRGANLCGANLRGANLYGANLCGANLRGANLYDANLRGADLYGANLHGADLYGANLCGANLRGANLRGANLRGANLYGANLYGANLHGADLHGANLRGANLCGANLRGANLRGANLHGADLHGADLCGADLYGAKNLSSLVLAQNIIVSQGDIIGYKKLQGDLICELLIPKEAKRLNAIGSRKCRAEYAKVIFIYRGEGIVKTGTSRHDNSFIYTMGDIVKPDSFSEDVFTECSNGIHFFITRIEAENY